MTSGTMEAHARGPTALLIRVGSPWGEDMDEVWHLSARTLADRIRRRECSAVEALDTYLDRIDALNPALNAVVSVNADQARQAATAVDRRVTRGQITGPFHGVPMVIKDGHDVAGLRTTLGTESLDRVPDRDGTVAAPAGGRGIILGLSNVPPLLAQYVTENSLFGLTNNPWNLRRRPGGSTGGGAARSPPD